MKRERTIYPAQCDFHEYWVMSKKGLICKLHRAGRDIRDQIVYQLEFPNGQFGGSRFTNEDLIENGSPPKRIKEELEKQLNEMQMASKLLLMSFKEKVIYRAQRRKDNEENQHRESP